MRRRDKHAVQHGSDALWPLSSRRDFDRLAVVVIILGYNSRIPIAVIVVTKATMLAGVEPLDNRVCRPLRPGRWTRASTTGLGG